MYETFISKYMKHLINVFYIYYTSETLSPCMQNFGNVCIIYVFNHHIICLVSECLETDSMFFTGQKLIDGVTARPKRKDK